MTVRDKSEKDEYTEFHFSSFYNNLSLYYSNNNVRNLEFPFFVLVSIKFLEEQQKGIAAYTRICQGFVLFCFSFFVCNDFWGK